MGGVKRFDLAGKKVVIKPNAAFANAPEAATTTLPELVGEMARICLEAGAASVLSTTTCSPTSPTRPCRSTASPRRPARRELGQGLRHLQAGTGRTITIPGAAAIVNPAVLNEVLDADFFINMPKANITPRPALPLHEEPHRYPGEHGKHAKRLTAPSASSTAVKPGLIAMDATNILLNKGRQAREDRRAGRGHRGARPGGVDSTPPPSSARRPRRSLPIAYAAELGVGTTDYASLGIRRVELAKNYRAKEDKPRKRARPVKEGKRKGMRVMLARPN